MQEEKSEINRKFCERIKDRRERLGLKPQEYADLLGVSRSRLGNWEAQINSAPRATITVLARKLNVSDAWLAGEVDVFQDNVLREEAHPYSIRIPGGAKGECMAHLERFLATCQDVPSRLGWTLEELRRHFPLNRWAEPVDATGRAVQVSADGRPLVRIAKDDLPASLVKNLNPLHAELTLPTGEADVPSESKSLPRPPSSPRPSNPPAAPKPAPAGRES